MVTCSSFCLQAQAKKYGDFFYIQIKDQLDEQTCCWCTKMNKASWFWEKVFGYNLCAVAGGGAVQAEQPGEAWPDSMLQDGR